MSIHCDQLFMQPDHKSAVGALRMGYRWILAALVGFQEGNPGHAVIHVIPERLKLNDQDLCDIREEHATYFWDKEVSLTYLRRESPFVARELVRQNRL